MRPASEPLDLSRRAPRWTRRRLLAALMAVSTALVLPAAGQRQPPQATFRSATDLVLIDASVVSGDGTPVRGLRPEQFEVSIDGRRRPIGAVEFLEVSSGGDLDVATPAGAASGSASRVVVIAVDEASFPASARASAREAAARVIDRAPAGDLIALIGFPGSIRVAPTRDRVALREALTRIAGARVEPPSSRFNLSAMEALQLGAREPVSAKEIIDRECQSDRLDPSCPSLVLQDGRSIALALEQQALTSIAGLHAVIDAVAELPGRKTLILMSAGLPLSRRAGNGLSVDSETATVARRAASANLNLYVFYMNVHFLRFFSPAYGRRNYSLFDDITLFGAGLEAFADWGGGSFAQIEVDADPFVDRMLRETSATYLVGVRVEPRDRDGSEHVVRVSVRYPGATVRHRRFVTIPPGGPAQTW